MSYYRQPPHRPYGSRIGFPPLTPTVRAIMIACGAVWGVQFVLRMFELDPSRLLGIVPASVARGWIWQPLTYMWLHAPFYPMHILLNMLFLWMLGGELERHWGSRAFLRYYLVCGIGAGVFITLGGILGDPFAATVGASGAIYGLILAFGKVFSERVILFMLVFPMKARTFAWIFFAMAFFFTWRPGTGVSHIAHLGGMVVGYLYLKRAWRVGEFFQELRWKLRRRKFKVMPPRDEDPWIH